MKRSLYSAVDEFSLSPLLAILPVRGRIGQIESLKSAMFARYERVAAQQQDAQHQADAERIDESSRRRLDAEAAMLKQVLEWLALKPGTEP